MDGRRGHYTRCVGNGAVAVVDVRMLQIRALLLGHTKSCFGAISTNGDSSCISWSTDGTVRKWNDLALISGVVEGSESFSVPNLIPFSLASFSDASNRLAIVGDYQLSSIPTDFCAVVGNAHIVQAWN